MRSRAAALRRAQLQMLAELRAGVRRRAAALVFDLGNVLIDVDLFRCARRWGALAGIDPRQLASRFRVDRHYEAHERGEIDHRQYFAVLREQLAIDLADEVMAEGWNAIIGEALPGLAEALTEAGRALPCFVLTNTNRLHESEWGPRHKGLLAPMAGIFSSWRLGCRKPERAIFQRVIAHQHGLARRDPLGTAPIIEYVLRLRAEVRALQRIAWSVSMRVPAAAISQALEPVP